MSSETLLFTIDPGDGSAERYVARLAPLESQQFPVFPEYDLALQGRVMQTVGRAHRRPGPRGARPRDRRRVAGLAVPPDAQSRRHRAVRHPAVHDGGMAVRGLGGRAAQARARVGARARAPALADARDRTTSRSSTVRSSRAGALDQHLDYQRWYYDWARDGETVPADRAHLRRARQDATGGGTDRPQLGRQSHRQHDVPRLRAGGRARLGDGRARAGRGRRGVDGLHEPVLRGPDQALRDAVPRGLPAAGPGRRDLPRGIGTRPARPRVVRDVRGAALRHRVDPYARCARSRTATPSSPTTSTT